MFQSRIHVLCGWGVGPWRGYASTALTELLAAGPCHSRRRGMSIVHRSELPAVEACRVLMRQLIRRSGHMRIALG
jgi:hypothetical protein